MDNNKNNFNYWLIILAVLVLMAFLPLSFKQFARALTGDYSATKTGLNVSDWQRLPADFVARSGGATSAMQGNLDMGSTNRIVNLAPASQNNDAVTLGAMNTAITNAVASTNNIKDTSGNSMKMVCGSTPTGIWEDVSGATDLRARITVDTSAGGFTGIPYYFTSISGSGWHYNTAGATSIYAATPTNFIVQVRYLGTETFTFSQANSWLWRINWCAIGN